MDKSRPKVCQSFRNPSHEGSEGRVTGVDFVGTYGSLASGYNITTFNINARNATLFPRLSAIASVWRRYYPRLLRFHLFGIAAATQQGYTAMSSLVTDDLATLVSPTTESQILNQEEVAVGRPWSYVVHNVNLGGLGLKWYTTDIATASSEFGEYIGRAFLGIPQTALNNDILIQVYVEYDVEFCQRIAASLVSEPIPEVSLQGGKIASGGSITASNLLGSSPTIDAQAVGLSVDSSGNVTIAKAGTYLVSFYGSGTLASCTATAGPNITYVTQIAILGASVWALLLSITTAIDGAVMPSPVANVAPGSTQLRLAQAPAGSLNAPLPVVDEDGDEDLDFAAQVARLKMRVDQAKPKFSAK